MKRDMAPALSTRDGTTPPAEASPPLAARNSLMLRLLAPPGAQRRDVFCPIWRSARLLDTRPDCYRKTDLLLGPMSHAVGGNNMYAMTRLHRNTCTRCIDELMTAPRGAPPGGEGSLHGT